MERCQGRGEDGPGVWESPGGGAAPGATATVVVVQPPCLTLCMLFIIPSTPLPVVSVAWSRLFLKP